MCAVHHAYTSSVLVCVCDQGIESIRKPVGVVFSRWRHVCFDRFEKAVRHLLEARRATVDAPGLTRGTGGKQRQPRTTDDGN